MHTVRDYQSHRIATGSGRWALSLAFALEGGAQNDELPNDFQLPQYRSKWNKLAVGRCFSRHSHRRCA